MDLNINWDEGTLERGGIVYPIDTSEAFDIISEFGQ